MLHEKDGQYTCKRREQVIKKNIFEQLDHIVSLYKPDDFQ